MAAARFWRLTGMVPAAADGLELSGLRLRLAGADVAGTLSATIAPEAGSLAALSDGDLQTSCSFAAAAVREPGFGFVWDLGSALDVDSFRVGSAPSATNATRWLTTARTLVGMPSEVGRCVASRTCSPAARPSRGSRASRSSISSRCFLLAAARNSCGSSTTSSL